MRRSEDQLALARWPDFVPANVILIGTNSHPIEVAKLQAGRQAESEVD